MQPVLILPKQPGDFHSQENRILVQSTMLQQVAEARPGQRSSCHGGGVPKLCVGAVGAALMRLSPLQHSVEVKRGLQQLWKASLRELITSYKNDSTMYARWLVQVRFRHFRQFRIAHVTDALFRIWAESLKPNFRQTGICEGAPFLALHWNLMAFTVDFILIDLHVV